MHRDALSDHPESVAVPLAAEPLDRDIVHRSDPALFDMLWSDPATRVLVMNRGKVLLEGRTASDTTAARQLSLRPVEEVSAALTRVYLGTVRDGGGRPAGTPVVLEMVTDAAASALDPDPAAWGRLRDSAAGLTEEDAAIFAEALAVANWHRSTGFCPSCGMPTVVEQGGWVRRCFTEDTLHFPRLNPAVILVVTDEDDRLLLGHNTAWPERRFSLLAGFVEPGETFEAAAVREIREESGLTISEPRYLSSQPWPFPASIMVGMAASVRPGADPASMQADGDEIAQLRWFTRAELEAEAGTGVLLPGGESIARRLIEDWFGASLGIGRAW